MSFLNQPLQNIFLQPKRMIGSIEVQVVLDESSVDDIEITQQPVQQGAMIADHAFKKPTSLSMTIYFSTTFGGGINFFSSTTSLKDLYQKLLDLQTTFQPFDVITPKRIYSNMLLKTLGVKTDKTSENILSVTCSFQEVIIVQVQSVQLQKSKQKNPKKTTPTANAGQKNSALQTGFKAFVPNSQGFSRG